jgi:hypothetical protein
MDGASLSSSHDDSGIMTTVDRKADSDSRQGSEIHHLYGYVTVTDGLFFFRSSDLRIHESPSIQ